MVRCVSLYLKDLFYFASWMLMSPETQLSSRRILVSDCAFFPFWDTWHFFSKWQKIGQLNCKSVLLKYVEIVVFLNSGLFWVLFYIEFTWTGNQYRTTFQTYSDPFGWENKDLCYWWRLSTQPFIKSMTVYCTI